MKTTQITRGLTVGAVALMLVATSFPAPVNAATTADLQAQIKSLLEQINKLTNQKGNAVSACVTANQDLDLGKSGAAVTELQQFLISKGYTIPAGATGYFGGQTQAALVQFQKTNNVSPAVGYYGPLTRAKVASLCTPANNPPTKPTEPTTPTKPTPDITLGGEGYFTRFDVKDGDDTDLEEGDKLASILEMSFDVESGDLNINRIEIAATPDVSNQEQDPWDTFTEFSVWDGKTLVGKIAADKEKNWKENSPTSGDYSLRIPSLNYKVKENKQITFTVKVTTAKNIKGISDGEIWNVFIPNEGIRALDADKAVVTTGDAADAVTLNIDSAGSKDELIIRRTDSDPDTTSIQLKKSSTSGFEKVFAFDIDTDDSKNDIEIRKLPIELTVSTSTMSAFVKNVRLVAGGKTYTKNAVVDGLTGVVTFEFKKGEFIVDAGDRETITVEVDFKALDTTKEGTTISGKVIGSTIKAEGGDTLTANQLSGVASGETHSLYTKGLIVVANEMTGVVTSSTGPLNDYVTLTANVKVTAFGQDVYIPTDGTGVTYQLTDSTGTIIATTSIAITDSSAKEIDNYFFIPEGETKTFSLEVTHTPGAANKTARLQMISLNFSDSAQAPNQTWLAQPQSKYRTPTKIIVD